MQSEVEQARAEVEAARARLERAETKEAALAAVASARAKRRRADAELVAAMYEAEVAGVQVRKICEVAGISRPAWYKWKNEGRLPAQRPKA